MAAAPQKGAGRSCSGAGHLYPVDIKDIKPEVSEAQVYHAKLLEQPSSAAEFFCVPGREKVKLEAPLMQFLPLYREENKCMLLVLTDPQDKNTVLAIYLHGSWWLVEDVMKTADASREGLIQVQTFAERVVLFVLNCMIFGMLERSLNHNMLFMPHSEKECAKIFWRNGDAAAFYTVKEKGSLCDGHTSRCYLLPVLDTVFVRKRFRRRGLGTRMVHNFCQTFSADDALGISCPVSADMYQVCQRFLETHPEEQSRLWEVEAPGDWSQRISIWLKIQLERNRPKRLDASCRMERFQDDEPGQSEGGQMNKIAGLFPDIRALPDAAKRLKDDPEKSFNMQPRDEGHVDRPEAEVRQCQGSKKRAGREEPGEDGAPKHFRAAS